MSDMCRAESKGWGSHVRYMCSRDRGHRGSHRVRNRYGEVIKAWSR